MASFASAQQETEDSSKVELFPKKYGDKKWKLVLGLDARRSFYQSQKVKINGLRIGAQFNGVHRFGFGFYALSEKLLFKTISVDEPNAFQPSKVLVDVNFNTIFYERVFLKTKKWEISLPLYLGGGKFKTQYLNTFGNYEQLGKTNFSTLGLSTQVKYYILPWLAPRVSFGYRQVFNTQKEISSALSRPFYAFGLSISLGELYRSIFNS